jgi:hypothetical protein
LNQNVKKKTLKKRTKKECRLRSSINIEENRSISNESDASLIQKVSAKRELFESTTNERKAAFVAEKIAQLRFSTTISFLQILQMLLR